MEMLKVHILRKLYKHTYIGRRHLAKEDLMQGLPKDKRRMKDIEKAVKELLNQGFLIIHKKGSRVSINPKMLKEIKEIVQ